MTSFSRVAWFGAAVFLVSGGGCSDSDKGPARCDECGPRVYCDAPPGQHASNESVVDDYVTNIPDFHRGSDQELSADVDAILRTHRRMINNLYEQLVRSDLSDERMVYVVYLLGVLHADVASDSLVKIIDYELRDARGHGMGRWLMYPAQEALVKIGSPSLRPLARALGVETNVHRRELMCETLITITGAPAAKDVLRDVLAQESEPAQRARLEDAISRMK